jgi:hypothetical protein
MLPSNLHDLMSRHRLLVAVVATIVPEQKVVVGDRALLDCDYSVRVQFDDLSVKEINDCLQGRILPMMAQQGRVCGVISKPDDNTIVGMYYHDDRDVVQRYQFSKELDAEIRELWSRLGGAP